MLSCALLLGSCSHRCRSPPQLRSTESSSNSPADEVQRLLARIEVMPQDADAHLSLGLMWRDLGLSIEAFESFNTVVELEHVSDMQASTACQHIGELLADAMKLPAEAEVALRQSVDLDSQNPGAWSALGKLLYACGALDEAHEALGKAAKLAPDIALQRVAYAQVLRSIGDFSEARTQYNAAAKLGCEELDQALSYYYAAEDEILTQQGDGEAGG